MLILITMPAVKYHMTKRITSAANGSVVFLDCQPGNPGF